MAAKYGSIQHMDDVFRRLAFGDNASKDPLQSTITALGLVLNYLDHRYNGRLIDTIYAPEMLSGSVWDGAKYPRTKQFRKVLQRILGVRTGQMRLWGRQFSDRFNKAWSAQYWVDNIFVRCNYSGLAKDKLWQLAIEEIAHSRPLIVIMRSLVFGEGSVRFHALVVCGYRISFTGARELMAHPGLYSEEFIKGSRVQPIFVPLSQAICGYSFNVLVKGDITVV